MSSIGSNPYSKGWELVSIAECERSGLLVTFFMAWSPGRRFNAGDSRLMTTETTPPSIPTNPATGPVEHANSEVVGIHASRSANRFEALEPVRQGVHRCFGDIAPGVARGLKLRHDHGSNYMSGDFQDEIECLGIEASPSFVREPEGNGVAERFIRTLKENLLWVRTFDTIEELRAALVEFATRYNETWLVARHAYRTPARIDDRIQRECPSVASCARDSCPCCPA